jgi:hypothetical protein
MQHRGLFGIVGGIAAFAALAALMPLRVPGQAKSAGRREIILDEDVPQGDHTKRRVACAEVISSVNHDLSIQHGRSADLARIARDLETNVTWVEHCMLAYGRRPKSEDEETSEAHETLLEQMEEDEPEETAPEDAAEDNVRERRVREEKEKQLRISRATPRSED